MLSINDYLLEYKRRIPNILFLWTMILTFIIISLLIINQTVTIKNYYQIQGIVNDKNISIYVLIKDLDKIMDNNRLYINNKKYTYKIRQISKDIVTSNTYFYKEILLDINLNENCLIDNNVVDIKFIVKEMTILEYIIDLIKGE